MRVSGCVWRAGGKEECPRHGMHCLALPGERAHPRARPPPPGNVPIPHSPRPSTILLNKLSMVLNMYLQQRQRRAGAAVEIDGVERGS